MPDGTAIPAAASSAASPRNSQAAAKWNMKSTKSAWNWQGGASRSGELTVSGKSAPGCGSIGKMSSSLAVRGKSHP